MATEPPTYPPAGAALQYGHPASDMMQDVSPTPDSQYPAPPAPPAPMISQEIGEPESPTDENADSLNDGRKAKRELSQSKRAAQNRAAQRAFRQRKEHYIKKLEQQVRDYNEMEQNYKAIQNDNYALREYVIQLQSRLLDVQVEPPQPPPNVNITPPTAPTSAAASRPLHPTLPSPTVASLDPVTAAANRGTLADVAAAVAGLSAREPGTSPSPESIYPNPPSFKSESAEDARNGEAMSRQAQDGLTHPSLRT
ncbi:AP-1-like transcription factor [Microdochium nivale]|nr:AP-1-like transcription factor [Microdochium nivale]